MKIIRLLILSFFLSFPTSIFTQNAMIDSLQHNLSLHTQEDTLRVNLLLEIVDIDFKTDLDKTLAFIEEAKDLSGVLNFKKGVAKSLYLKGKTTAFHTNFKDGFQFYEEALKLYEGLIFKSGIAECYKDMARFNYRNGRQKQAIEYYEKSLKIYEEIDDKEEMFSVLNSIGWSYIQIGNYTEAISNYEKALDFNEEIKNNRMLPNCYQDLGVIYTYQGNYLLALDYFKKSLLAAEENSDSLAIASTLGNMGPVYNHLEKYDEAIDCYKKSMSYLKDSYKGGHASNLNNLGLAYKDLKQFELALEHYKAARKIYKEINNTANEALTLNNIGDVSIAQNEYDTAFYYFTNAKINNLEVDNQRGACASYLGLAKVYNYKKNYDEALTNALKCKQIADELEMLLFKREANELLAIIYNNTGQYKKAFASHQQFKTLNDSLFNKENIQKVTQLEYEYKYKQELELASLRELQLNETVNTTSQNLQNSQRNLLLGVIGFLLVTLILGTVIFYLKLRNAKSKTQNIAIEQKLLRSQMTPHFIFNSLSVLQGIILNKEDEKAILYLSKFSKLLRITLENSRDKMVPLHQELTAINNYLELQNLEVSQYYQYTLTVDDSIGESSFEIPPMLIQPFIENAIEHGFKTIKENRKIDVQLKYSNKELICTITDNGIGIDMQKLKKRDGKKSLATTITSERLKMLSKDFKIDGSITIEDRKKYNDQGTIVTIVIPYKTHLAS